MSKSLAIAAVIGAFALAGSAEAASKNSPLSSFSSFGSSSKSNSSPSSSSSASSSASRLNAPASLSLASFGSSFGGGSIFNPPRPLPVPPPAATQILAQFTRICDGFGSFLRTACLRTFALIGVPVSF